MNPTSSFITIRHLKKHNAQGDPLRTIFTDLTLDIRRGEFVALLLLLSSRYSN
jgi:ABC-type nitrate/sulfonate/bicarbonate transport system ATPase subunit